jgi:hypothetical protein
MFGAEEEEEEEEDEDEDEEENEEDEDDDDDDEETDCDTNALEGDSVLFCSLISDAFASFSAFTFSILLILWPMSNTTLSNVCHRSEKVPSLKLLSII